MRTTWYAVLNNNTGEKTMAGISYTRAQELLTKMQNENKTEKFSIVYKWRSL